MSERPVVERIKVVVVEDHFLPRFAVTRLIEDSPDMTVVAEAETGWRAIELYREHRPDVVLMDLRLPELDGTSATAALVREFPDARVLVLSHYESEADVGGAMRAGARGFLKKDVKGETLLGAIREVAAGRSFVPEALADRLAATPPGLALSKRELDILKLVFKGLSNPEIGAALGISEGTVRVHMSNIMNKLGVKRRTEAVNAALGRGLLRVE
jgi:two-component system, NarL family, response regulator